MKLRSMADGSLLSAPLLSALIWIALFPHLVHAGDFRVTPIRLELSGGIKSGALSVINEGKSKLNLQVRASEWTQNESGKDTYRDTADIIFYPKIMEVEAGETQIIRAGTKGRPPAREKTYRLFIEEIPEPKKNEGVNVAIAIRFGVPIFVKPQKERASGVVDTLALSGGASRAVVRNTGNVHVIITSVIFRGKGTGGEETFSKEIAGWYLLAGAARPYEAPVPPDICDRLSLLEVEVTADKFTLHSRMNVTKELCRP